MQEELSPLDLITLNEPGYEVWASERTFEIKGHLLPKLLVVVFDNREAPVFTVIDPRTNEEEFSTEDYVDVMDYMCGEEFMLVEGATTIEPDDEDDESTEA